MQKSLKLLVALSVVLITLYLTERIFFSWVGLISSQVGLCRYKTIGVPTANAESQTLALTYNLQAIASSMVAKSTYKVIYDEAGLTISRKMNGISYNIIFTHDTHNREMTRFNLSTTNFEGYANGSTSGGEKCTTPSHSIAKNVYDIIDELGLNEPQETELKQYVQIRYVSDFLGNLF